MALTLTKEEEDMLAGKRGPGIRKCMDLMVQMANVFDIYGGHGCMFGAHRPGIDTSRLEGKGQAVGACGEFKLHRMGEYDARSAAMGDVAAPAQLMPEIHALSSCSLHSLQWHFDRIICQPSHFPPFRAGAGQR